MKINGTMTTSTVKPRTLDKDGLLKNPEYLAITFKTELDNLSDEELGQLLSLGATGEELEITVASRQPRMNFSKPEESQESEESEREKSFTEIKNEKIAELQEMPEHEGKSLLELSEIATEMLDIPY